MTEPVPEAPEVPNEMPLTLDGLKEVLAAERAENAKEVAKVVDSKIEALRTPDRSTVEALGIGNTEHPIGATGDIRTTSEIARGTAVSRIQPLDYYYRTLPEAEQMWRTRDSDHWCSEWIRAQYLKDFGRMQKAEDKAEEWIRHSYGRADTLEGDAVADGALSDGTGGPLIPRPLEQLILIARDAVGKMRRFASPFNMTRQTHTLPTAAAMTFGMSAEATTPAGGEPDLDNVQITAQKGVVKAIVSLEVLDDEAVNLIQAYTTRAGMAIGAGEDVQFWSTGDGTPPNISSKIDGTAFTESTSTIMAFVDVVEMYYAVDQVYRDNAAWYIAPNVLEMLTLVVDGNSARQFYGGLGDSIGPITDDSGAIGILLRKPVFEVPAPAGVIMFGDMRAAYVVATRQGITATSSEHVHFDLQKVMWLWTTRFDGQDVDAVAVQRAAGITSATNNPVPD